MFVLDLLYWLLTLFSGFLLLSVPILFLAFLYLRSKLRGVKAIQDTSRISVGFFHPYCNAGGGGERVLWCAVRCINVRYPAARIIIYTGDTEAAPDMILSRARERFNMTVPQESLEFVYLHRRTWLEASNYPCLTLLGQAIGSLVVGLEALLQHVPSIYIDTMGYAFTLPLARYLGGCSVGAYVHYPTVSTDMLARVKSRTQTYNNRGMVARSPLVSRLKVLYYRLFSLLYGWCGAAATTVMVNSSWTQEHIQQLWGGQPCLVYPPCDITHLEHLTGEGRESKQVRVLSIGQFRPEKDHVLQIKSMFELRQIVSDEQWTNTKLVIVGGCRGKEDWDLVKDLKDLTRYLSVEDNVEFRVNLPFPDLLQEFSNSLIGIHTMWNEHFGIGVVEMMSAGLLTIAHRSGGPLMDIIVEESGSRNGFLACSAQEYAAHIAFIINNMNSEAREQVVARARASSHTFNNAKFESGWIRATDPLFSNFK